jgi:hypothetical protein
MPLSFNPDTYPTPLAAAAAVAGDPIDQADRGDDERGISRPLDKDAKWRLVRLAKEAWFAETGTPAQGKAFDEWKRFQARQATGGLSISEACVRHYRLIQAHFLRLKGAVKAAQHAEQRAALGALEIARNALKRTLAETKQDWQAARTIAARFYKGAALKDLTAKQVWSICFTLRNNANAAAGRGHPSNRFKAKRAKRAEVRSQKSKVKAAEPQPSPSPAPWLL